jgi:hypothetical protein
VTTQIKIYETIIFPVRCVGVKLGLPYNEGRVENRALITFGPGMGEERGGWRKVQNEELLNFFSSLDITRIK